MDTAAWRQVLDEISRGSRHETPPLRIRGPQTVGEVPTKAGPRLRRLGGLLTRMERAEEQLELAPLPAGDTGWHEARPRNQKHNLRKEAVRARLRLLGYYAGAEGDSTTLRDAVSQFQRDTDLTVDGWVGWHTWEALDEFVTLEPPLKLDRWYPKSKGACPALVRATAVRLQTLGFFKLEEDEGKRGEQLRALRFEDLMEPLVSFGQAVEALGMAQVAGRSERELVELLFDDELLLSLAAGARAESSVFRTPLNLTKPEGDPASRLLRRMVRGELWLHGYEVGDLRGSTQVELGKLRGSAQVEVEKKEEKSLIDGLRAFWRNRGILEGEELEARSRRVDHALLLELKNEHEGHGRGEGGSKEKGDEHEWVARFVAENPDRLREVWERAIPCKPLFFIWDGVKRCGRWLRKQLDAGLGRLRSLEEVLGKGVEYAKTFLWNVVRYVFQQGSRIFSMVRKAIAAFLKGIQPFLDGGIDLRQGEERVACKLGLDVDMRLMIGGQSPASLLSDMTQSLEVMAQCLQVGTAVLSEILYAETKLLRGPQGWMALLSHLVREAPRWERYMQGLANLPPLPRSETPKNTKRRLLIVAIAAAVVAIFGGVGVLNWWVFTAHTHEPWTSPRAWVLPVSLGGLTLLAGAVWRWGRSWLQGLLR